MLQARSKIVKMFKELIEERRACPSCKDDLLHSLLKNDDTNAKQKLSDDQIIDLMLILVYSGFETVSTTSMMTVKYLHDHPRALEELRVTTNYFHEYLANWFSLFTSLPLTKLFSLSHRTNKWISGGGNHLEKQ